MIIGVDLDNTLIKLDVLKVIERKYKIKCNKNHDWDFSSYPEHIRTDIFDLFKSSDFMCNVKPLRGAQNAIKRLSKKHTIVLITARHAHLNTETRKLVEKLFPEIKDFNSVGLGGSKKSLFIEKKIDVWIDDASSGVADALSLGISTYLISHKNSFHNFEARKLDKINVVKSISNIKL